MTIPANIEYAGGGCQITDDQLRVKLRNAPAWVTSEIDSDREQRGLRPLFAVRAAVPARWSSAPPVAPMKLPKAVTTLTCLVAPGVSEPLPQRSGERPQVEHITVDAWRSALATIQVGRHIDIQCGHDDNAYVLARSGTPAVRFVVSDRVGLVVTVDLRDCDTPRRPDTCSIAFRSLKEHTEHRGGQLVRVVDDLVLDHIALGERTLLQPYYPLARVVRSMKWNARSAGLDAVAAVTAEMRKSCPYILTR